MRRRLGGALDAREILRGHHDRDAEAAALGKQDLKTPRLDGRVLVHDDSERRACVRRKRAQHVGEPALHMAAETHGAGVAHGGEADLPKGSELLRVLVHGRNECDVDAASRDDIDSVHLAVCGHEDAPVVVYEEGQGTAKVGSGVAVLIAEGPRLSVKGQVFVPADCREASF